MRRSTMSDGIPLPAAWPRHVRSAVIRAVSIANVAFIRAFVGGVRVDPGEARLEVEMRRLPALRTVLPRVSAPGLVARARYEPLQIDLHPLDMFLEGVPRAA
jgi:hypothetical protein